MYERSGYSFSRSYQNERLSPCALRITSNTCHFQKTHVTPSMLLRIALLYILFLPFTYEITCYNGRIDLWQSNQKYVQSVSKKGLAPTKLAQVQNIVVYSKQRPRLIRLATMIQMLPNSGALYRLQILLCASASKRLLKWEYLVLVLISVIRWIR